MRQTANPGSHLKIIVPASPTPMKDLRLKTRGKASIHNQAREAEKQTQEPPSETGIERDLSNYQGRVTRRIGKAMHEQGLIGDQAKKGQENGVEDEEMVVDQDVDKDENKDANEGENVGSPETGGSLQQLLQGVERLLTRLTMTHN